MRKYTQFQEQKIKDLINRFIKENNREPKAIDFDSTEYLPSARNIQRRWGGLQNLRKILGLSVINHSAGKERGKTMKGSMRRSKEYEDKLHNELYIKYHNHLTMSKTVERELEYHQYADNAFNLPSIRSDSAIIDRDNNHIICFDYFYPQTIQSLQSCVRAKRKKFIESGITYSNKTFENIFVCVNPQFTQEKLDKMNIKRGGYQLLSLETFREKFL